MLVFLLQACSPEVKNQENIINNDYLVKDFVNLCCIPKDTLLFKLDSTLEIPDLGDTIIFFTDTGQYNYLESYSKLINDNGQEQFINFLYHFANNPFFQKRRISFPLTINIIDFKEKRQNQVSVKESNFNKKVFQNFIGLHWLPYSKSLYNDSNSTCVNFEKITKLYIVSYYFTRDSIWHLTKIQIKYPDSLININQNTHEYFDDFLFKFISDSTFNKSRILFPFLFYSTPNDLNENPIIDSIYINEWVPSFGYKYNENDVPYYGIYFNFNKSYPNSDTMNIRFSYNDNGINFGYDFINKEGKWFLFKGEDHSN